MTELEKQQLEQLTPKRRRKWPIIVVTVIVIVVVVLLLLLRSCTPQQEQMTLERELAAELGLLPGMTEAEIQDRLNRTVADSMMNVSINPTPVFPSGRSE